MSSDFLDEFSRKVGSELLAAINLSSAMARKLNKDFITELAFLNDVCGKLGISIFCVGAMGIISIKYIVSIFAEPAKLLIVGLLNIPVSLFSFGAGLLVAAILHRIFIDKRNSCPH